VVLDDVEGALVGDGFDSGFGGSGLHFDSVAQFAIFSTVIGRLGASNEVRFDSKEILRRKYDGSQR
jgi:hypothetical protein